MNAVKYLYDIAVTEIAGSNALLFLLLLLAGVYGLIARNLVLYARILGRSLLWWLCLLGMIAGLAAVLLWASVVFRDQVPPLNIWELCWLASQFSSVAAVTLYLQGKRRHADRKTRIALGQEVP